MGAIAVIKADLSDVYRDYVACLNKQTGRSSDKFVHDEVIHNGVSGDRGVALVRD